MPQGVQELKWLESHAYTSWGTHVSRCLDKKHSNLQEFCGLSGACAGTLNGHIAVLVGGKENLPIEDFTSVSRLELFDLITARWLTEYDVHGKITHRIGHSVVTLDDKAYVFGGEPLVDNDCPDQHCLNEVYEISFENSVLYCTDISPVSSSESNSAVAPAPCERAWHASASVQYREAASGPEGPFTQGVLILGGKNSQGAVLADVWLLTVNIPGQKPYWTQLSPTGSSPLPLVFHNAVSIHDRGKVVVIGGKQHSNPRVAGMNAGIHILDLSTNAWTAISTGSDDPEMIPHTLTARCCATAMAMQPPLDEDTGAVRRIKSCADSEKGCAHQEAVLIFGGFSEYEPVLIPSSMLIFEPKHSRVREVQLPNAGIKTYMAHASAVCPDKRGFFLFGGAPTPEVEDDDDSEQQFLDTTTMLDFWKTPADFPSEAEEEAQRLADANPIKTKTLSNGDVYVGEMNPEQTKRHGKGKCTYANGDEYDGDWRDDQRCGQGVVRYADSLDVYAGQWDNDQRHGYGIYEYNVPDAQDRDKTLVGGSQQRQAIKYEGQWSHDQKHGAGTLTYCDGTKLVGTWINDVLDSREKCSLEGYDDGHNGVCSYVGEVRDGVPHGQGESNHPISGEVYVGNWVAGQRCGSGVVTLRDGSVYRGEWRNGRRNGFGVFDDVRTRAHYDGKWVGGVRCGRGVCTYANGCSYEGDWLDDVRHGAGCYTLADGSCYDGAWHNDTFCDDGSFLFTMDDNDSQQDLNSEEIAQ